MATNLVNVKSSTGVITPLSDEMIINKTDEFIKDLKLPSSYNYSKAIKSFCLALPDVKGIERATARSVFLAAQEYVNKGYDISKNQCALIMYGDKLTVQKQYQGNVALAKASNPHIVDITSSAIYENDIIVIEKKDGRTIIVTHETKLENMNNKVIGAYATAIYDDGTTNSEIMTMSMIEMSWSMSKAGTMVHKKFPAQMARKTVLNKLCLDIINSSLSDSNDLILDEMEQYEENLNNQEMAQNDNVIDMDDFNDDNNSVQVEEDNYNIDNIIDQEEKNSSMSQEVKEEVVSKRQEILDELKIDDPLNVQEKPKEEDMDEVLKRFNSIKEQPQEEKKEIISDNRHCQKCGKELSETSIKYYDSHPNLARLCYKCNKEENN